MTAPTLLDSPDQRPASDVQRMLDMFDGLGLSDTADSMRMITIPGAPWSKSRPRFARNGHTYTKPEDHDAEKRTATFMRSAVRQPFTGNVGLACLFFRPNRQRIDADNLIKHVCDAANGVLWIDDSQCTAVMGVMELDTDKPRTVIVVGEHESTLRRGTDATIACQVCGGPIYLDNVTGKVPKTCSPKCRLKVPGAAGSLAELVPCLHCGEPFKRVNHAQKLCSTECRYGFIRDKKRASALPFSRCTTCDAELAHRRGGRCRNCWRANAKVLKP